ncbi:helix-turn-helix domain-containing protein [Deinococcus sp. QL22]|uniref:helix-turn-helix domain-containing protein n=1 Tax=Deinococcus sp. QL22 TaxID=2939437 RepID=UPI0020181691|nr:helix-turn-helix domain-containing protein [Deinococcus sp. QL22]UQN05348.1 helix-turn-helix domain-containing protein [Deinococcus sp. QL22]
MTKGKNDGFFMIDNNVVDGGTLAAMSGSTTKIYIALVRFSNSGKSTAWPSYSKLRECAGLGSDSSVKKGIDELVKLGVVSMSSQGNNLKSTANTYKVVSLGVKSHNPSAAVSTPVLTHPALLGNSVDTTPVELAEAVAVAPAGGDGESAECANEAVKDMDALMMLAGEIYDLAVTANYTTITSIDKDKWLSSYERLAYDYYDQTMQALQQRQQSLILRFAN